MNKDFKVPPGSMKLLTSPADLALWFEELVGIPFKITEKTRTDGSNLRKLIAATLEKHDLPELAYKDQYEIVPPKKKGVPKILREFIDTYIVTRGDSYNLQVWNRIPASNSLLVKYENGESLKCTDVRFVFARIDIEKSIIASVIILTPEYIEKNFGKFGKPTIKHQLLISSKARNEVLNRDDKILLFPDTIKLSYLVKNKYTPPPQKMVEEPEIKEIFSIKLVKELVAEKLIGTKFTSSATKNRGQALERKVLELLGYEKIGDELLYGGFPDIPNQLLEVKVQDTQTVDLGKFSPEKEEIVFQDARFTTFDIRYLIALTNPDTEIIEGIILAPGEKLGELFSYVSNESYKCQRSIPIRFFDKYKGCSVFNPE